MQLEGDVETRSEPDRYVLTMTFKLAQGHHDAGGDTRNVVLTSAAKAGSRH